MRSLMCTLGKSSILVCWERCNAASQAPRSWSVSGNIECLMQHLESMGAVFDSFINKTSHYKIKNGNCIEYIKDVLVL